MHFLLCGYCKKEFISKHHKQKYCSHDCFGAARKEYNKIYKTPTIYKCKDCQGPVSYNAFYEGGRCKTCNAIYRKSIAVTLKDYYCSLCANPITYYSSVYGTGLCHKCSCKEWIRCKYPLQYQSPDGYIHVRVYDHPFATKAGYVMEHRLVMEKHLGRYLAKHELVHHLNGIRDDNLLENLAVVDSSKHEKHTLEKLLKKRIIELENLLNDQKS